MLYKQLKLEKCQNKGDVMGRVYNPSPLEADTEAETSQV
jgi:hypothetical protein